MFDKGEKIIRHGTTVFAIGEDIIRLRTNEFAIGELETLSDIELLHLLRRGHYQTWNYCVC